MRRCQLLALEPLLPKPLCRIGGLSLLYSTERDGTSFGTLMRAVQKASPTLLVVRAVTPKGSSEPFGVAIGFPWPFPPVPRDRMQMDDDPNSIAIFTCVPVPPEEKAQRPLSMAPRRETSKSSVHLVSLHRAEQPKLPPPSNSTPSETSAGQGFAEIWARSTSACMSTDVAGWFSISREFSSGRGSGPGMQFGGTYGSCALSISRDLTLGSSWGSAEFMNTRGLSSTPQFKIYALEVWAPIDQGRRRGSLTGDAEEEGSDIETHNLQVRKSVAQALIVPMTRRGIEEWGRREHGYS
eukprot:Polyplicarium_translucidae@DN2454_c0_g1_i4.p1